MPTFLLTIDTDNAAFGDDATERDAEISRILLVAAAAIIDRGISTNVDFPIHDHNGNKIGTFSHSSPRRKRSTSAA